MVYDPRPAKFTEAYVEGQLVRCWKEYNLFASYSCQKQVQIKSEIIEHVIKLF